MAAKLENDLLLRALKREPVDRTPVWIMRQAGRYLPEYREIREQAGDFMSLCRNKELACEVTLQPLERYRLDAAILFSDILTIPDALGLGLYFEPGEGPRFEKRLSGARDIRGLASKDIESRLSYVFDAVALIRQRLEGSVPLIGFAGSPWTVATYMIEGRSSRDFERTLKLGKEDPALLEELLEILAAKTTDYLNAQIESGAQAIQVFDTWGGVLEGDSYRRWSLAPMERILEGLKRRHDGADVPVILFTKGAGARLALMADSGCDALGVDWTITLREAREITEDRVALQGNVDPATLRKSPKEIREAVAEALASYGRGYGHVFNLGHGITPDVDPEHLGVLVDAVHEMSPAYKAGAGP